MNVCFLWGFESETVSIVCCLWDTLFAKIFDSHGAVFSSGDIHFTSDQTRKMDTKVNKRNMGSIVYHLPFYNGTVCVYAMHDVRVQLPKRV